MSSLWLAYDNCRLAMASGQAASNLTKVKDKFIAIDQGETLSLLLQNYESYSRTPIGIQPTEAQATTKLNENEQLEYGSHLT